MVIPAELTARHGVRQEDVFRRGGNADGISDAVFEFATVANDNLLTAREMFKQSGGDGGKVPRHAMPVFLYGVRPSMYLELTDVRGPGRKDADGLSPDLTATDARIPRTPRGSQF